MAGTSPSRSLSLGAGLLALVLFACNAGGSAEPDKDTALPPETDLPPVDTDAPDPDTADTDPTWEDTDPFAAGEIDDTDDTDDTGTPLPGVELLCFDGLDDDGDGLIDCEDGDCAAVCFEPICDDGVDDDLDGDVDCWDEDCWGTAACLAEVHVTGGHLRVAQGIGGIWAPRTWTSYSPGGSCVGSENPRVSPLIPPYGYSGSPPFIEAEDNRATVTSLVGEVRLDRQDCALTVPRIEARLLIPDTPGFHDLYLPSGASVAAPCDALLARHGGDAVDLVRGLWFADRQRLGRTDTPPLRLHRGLPTTSWASHRSTPSGSGFYFYLQGRMSAYPVALSASTTASSPAQLVCAEGGRRYVFPYQSGSAQGPLRPTRFPVDPAAPGSLP